jgi:hypothetical protein
MKKILPFFLMLAMVFSYISPANATEPGATVNVLKNIPVTGVAGAENFTGKLTISDFSLAPDNSLLVSGVLQGKVNGKPVKQIFTNIPATLLPGTESAALQVSQASCQILFLDIGPIFLDILGLQLDLSRIVLDLTAVAGPGNLLGNLLCALVGILDPTNVLTNLQGILQSLLNAINSLL